MTTDRLEQQIRFILEIDKLKHIFRQSHLIDSERRENSAEHSWHLALMAMILAEYAEESVNLLHIIKMLLIHDLVEIDAAPAQLQIKRQILEAAWHNTRPGSGAE